MMCIVRGGTEQKDLQGNSDSYADLNEHNLAWSNNLFEPIRHNIVDFSNPVAYKGTGMKLDSENSYVFPILSGDEHVYATNPNFNKKDKTSSSFKVVGEEITLVAGYQSRYNQRAVISGSLDLCTDDLISVGAPKNSDFSESSNWILCKNILDWNFQQKSVLKAENMHHQLIDKSLYESGHQNSQEYKLKDYIHLELDIYEKVNGEWVPFKTNDIQFEFIMLNPYWRVFLSNTQDSKYEIDFRAPDWNGVYKFLVDYNRFGYTRLYLEDTSPVRVYRHDEFPRYIPSAFPYYLSVFTTLIGTVVFTVLFLHVDNTSVKVVKGGKVKKE
jgi:oligosaccharyltransferase complex subunit beta